MTFEDLKFEPRRGLAGIQCCMDFPNGYGVSVVRGYGTYGGEEGLYEAAVIHEGRLCYDTPITDDVVGYLNEAAVVDFIEKVKALPKRATQ